MKTTKFSITVCVLILSAGLVFAEKPTNKKDFTINLSENLFRLTSRDVMLTDSQKVVLLSSAKDYEVKMKDLKGKTNSNDKKIKTNEAVLTYRAKLNQVLSQEQKDTIEMKRIQRAIKYATKNNQK